MTIIFQIAILTHFLSGVNFIIILTFQMRRMTICTKEDACLPLHLAVTMGAIHVVGNLMVTTVVSRETNKDRRSWRKPGSWRGRRRQISSLQAELVSLDQEVRIQTTSDTYKMISFFTFQPTSVRSFKEKFVRVNIWI